MQKSHIYSVKTLAYSGTVMVGLLLTAVSWADAKQWTGKNGNGHYYERFDSSQIAWQSAKYKCGADDSGGYLATLTSLNEQNFVAANFIIPSNGANKGYYIGGFKGADKKWHWDNKDIWKYVNWGTTIGEQTGQYLSLHNDSYWRHIAGSSLIDGYICEWNGQKSSKTLSATVAPNIGSSSAPELAVLYQDLGIKKHRVEVKDSVTNIEISRLSFALGKEASVGMVVLKNIETSNTTPEIGVLLNTNTGSIVQIKDIKNDKKLISSISVLDSNYTPKAISVSPDINANGSEEITVFGKHKKTGKVRMEIHDSKTKAVLLAIDP